MPCQSGGPSIQRPAAETSLGERYAHRAQPRANLEGEKKIKKVKKVPKEFPGAGTQMSVRCAVIECKWEERSG